MKPGELEVAFEGDGAQPVKVPVDGVPEPTPPPPPAPTATTLTQSCPTGVAFNTQGPTNVTVTGTLAGAPAGSTVTVRFQHPPRETSGPPIVPVDNVNVQTAANGTWTATVQTTNRQDLGTWNVSSSFAGTSQYLASSAPSTPCNFEVFDNS